MLRLKLNHNSKRGPVLTILIDTESDMDIAQLGDVSNAADLTRRLSNLIITAMWHNKSNKSKGRHFINAGVWQHCSHISEFNWSYVHPQWHYTHKQTKHSKTMPWRRHQMETFSALLARNSLVTGEFPSQRPVTRSFDVFLNLRMNKRLSKRSRHPWFETPSRSLWRHSDSAYFMGCIVFQDCWSGQFCSIININSHLLFVNICNESCQKH